MSKSVKIKPKSRLHLIANSWNEGFLYTSYELGLIKETKLRWLWIEIFT